jgi:hypothetical protein
MAYLGKAGTSMTDIMAAMLDEEDSDGGDSDGFGAFIESMAGIQSDTALSDLSKAKEAFNDYTNVQASLNDGSACTDENTVDSSDIGGVCMISGFVDVVKTTTAFDAIAGGQIDAWLNDTQEEGKTAGTLTTMDHSACVLQFAVDNQNSALALSNPAACTQDTVDIDVDVNATEVVFNGGKSYSLLTLTSGTFNADPAVSTQNITYHLLKSQTIGSDDIWSNVFTTDYCDVNYQNVASEADIANNIYPCPTTRAEDDLTVEDFIVDAFNNGIDSIVAVVNSSGLIDEEDMAEDSDIDEAVNDFKTEICEISNGDGASACSADNIEDFTIEISDIIAFINDDSI